MNRKKAREYAFILLFQYKFQPEDILSILDEFVEEYNPGNQTEYIEGVVKGVLENIEEIDSKIEQAANGWTVNRMSCVCAAILRLAVYEILYRDDIPVPVTLNEATGLAKTYDTEEAAPFVNGILGGISGAQGRNE